MIVSSTNLLASLVLSVLVVGASPVDVFTLRDSLDAGSNNTLLQGREPYEIPDTPVHLGYRYVIKEKAVEYNEEGTLTSIPAEGKTLGQGAYFSPRLGMFDFGEDYWECTLAASAKYLHPTPMLYVADVDATNGQPNFLNHYVQRFKKIVDYTLLFAEHYADPGNIIGLIPPKYLKKSPKFHTPLHPYGKNSLKINAWCVPRGCTGKFQPSAAWHWWGISRWPQNLVVRTAEEEHDVHGPKQKCQTSSSTSTGHGKESAPGVPQAAAPPKGVGKAKRDICAEGPPQPEWVKTIFSTVCMDYF